MPILVLIDPGDQPVSNRDHDGHREGPSKPASLGCDCPIRDGIHAVITAVDEFAHIWTFRDGLAIRFEAFLERDDALEAAGLSE